MLSDLPASREKLALGTVENCISALRFLYKKTLKRRDRGFDDLPFPTQPRTLPTVLSQGEVARLIEAAHRMLLMLLYATGMRRTEVTLMSESVNCTLCPSNGRTAPYRLSSGPNRSGTAVGY